MFIDNTNVTDINDLAEMKAFAKGLAIGFKTQEKDVMMGIIANGLRSHISDVYSNNKPVTHGWNLMNLISHPKNRHVKQSRSLVTRASRRNRVDFKFHPKRGHNTPAFKRAEAYLLAKQKKAIPPILNDVLFVLISGAESDVEVHAPVKEMKSAGAKIVAIGVGKDAKIGKLGSDADEKFMVPPGAGNAIVNAIVVAICKKCKSQNNRGLGGVKKVTFSEMIQCLNYTSVHVTTISQKYAANVISPCYLKNASKLSLKNYLLF